MQDKIGQALHSAAKVSLIALLLGLGVNYGFFVPKGKYNLDYAGILGSAADVFLKFTLIVYVIYRLLLNFVKWIRTKRLSSESRPKNMKLRIAQLFLLEVVLLILVISPIALGIYWSQVNFELTDLWFIVSRLFSASCIIATCTIIYSE